MENIRQQSNFDTIIQSLSSLNLSELDLVMSRLIGLRRQKLPSVLTEMESDLLKKINMSIPTEIQKRYDLLIDKRDGRKLTDVEYNELIELTNYTEQHTVQRLEYLLELSKLRNVSLDDLMDELELKPGLNVTS